MQQAEQTSENKDSTNKPKTILLVDGSNLAFRMYFALESTGMTSPSGKPSWAIFGFFKALLDVIEKNQPDAIVAAFDCKEATFRHEAFDYYKANRPDEMPEALALQWPEIKRGLSLIGMGLIELPGYEADDLIGTLSVQAYNSCWETLILSGDKDNLQLVNERVKVLMPSPKGINLVGIEEVKVKMGVLPEQVVDFKALCGDSSDNIPGVPGIGEKTAVKLISEYGTIDNIYENIERVGTASLKKKLTEGRESAMDSRFLATIKTNCPIAYPFDELSKQVNPKMAELVSFLREYKLASLEKRLPKMFKSFGALEAHQDSLFDALTESEQNHVNGKTEQEEIQPVNVEISKQLILEETQLKEVIQKISVVKEFAIDLETEGLSSWENDIVGWALAWKSPMSEMIESVYIPTKHLYLGSPNQLCNEFVSNALRELIEKFGKKIIIQNAKFEYKFLQNYGITLPDGTIDTMLASYIENPDQSHGLKNQVLRVFKYQMTQIDSLIGAKGKTQKSMSEVDVEKVFAYACDDAAWTYALYEHYLKILNEAQTKLWLEVESPLALLLARMELRGLHINVEKLQELTHDLSTNIQRLEGEIFEKFELPHFNLNSSQQLAQALTSKGFKLGKTSTGQMSTDGRLLNDLIESDSSGLITLLIEYRGLSKLRSTYTESLAKQVNSRTCRLHGEFNQALTTTGRLSSSNPNLQNIPVKNQKYGKLIRASFDAEDGKILVCADYSQIELRILAHFTEDPTLIDAFTSGQDIHSRTAAEIFDLPLADVTPEMRRLGKTLNFALIYQQGTYATAKQLGISNKEAADFIEKYFLKFPRIKPFMNDVLETARTKGFVETIWGRRRYFQNLSSNVAVVRKAEERAAFNAPLQGSASDLMKKAMLSVENECTRSGINSRLILQVHDEIVMECDQSQKEATLAIVQREMELGQPFKVPIEVHVSSGFNWAECK
jgi:DNA polymerase-1